MTGDTLHGWEAILQGTFYEPRLEEWVARENAHHSLQWLQSLSKESSPGWTQVTEPLRGRARARAVSPLRGPTCTPATEPWRAVQAGSTHKKKIRTWKEKAY